MNLRRKIRDWLFSDIGFVAVCRICGKMAHAPMTYGSVTVQLCVEHLEQWGAYALQLPGHRAYIVASMRVSSMKGGLLPFDEAHVNEYLTLEKQGQADLMNWLEG